MIEQILAYLNNYFLLSDGTHHGVFTIENGSIDLPFMVSGQYFRIIDSKLNDGVYEYPAYGLRDEVFDGTVWALAVPPAVVSLASDVEKWEEVNGNAGPYTSESFGGYTYTRATNAKGGAVTWQDAFRSRLNRWRKI